MKTFLARLFVLIALTGWALQSRAAVTVSITPSAVSNTYTGTIALQVTGLTNGETVFVQKFVDANQNGGVDAGDMLWQAFKVTDGQASVFQDGATAVTNLNVPGDSDTVQGQITALLNLSQSGFEQTLAGKYLYVVTSPVGNFPPLTNSFAVTNFPFGQAVSGNVIANGTNVPAAAVLLFQSQETISLPRAARWWIIRATTRSARHRGITPSCRSRAISSRTPAPPPSRSPAV